MAQLPERGCSRLDRLIPALTRCWSRETSADPDRWSVANPAWGQCAVTALIIQDFLGGDLVRCEVAHNSHYWNVLPSGEEIDLTGQQFRDNFIPSTGESRSRRHVLGFPETRRRYEALLAAVLADLALVDDLHP
jgi:hypothetical protein